MKKYLLGTTALAVAAFMASPLSAADAPSRLKLGVGGFMEHAIGYAKNDDLTATKYSNFAIESDAELLFRGNITTDSGIKFDARFELEANLDSDNVTVDEMFVQISTPSLGLIEIGSTDGVGDTISGTVPKVGWGLADADDWIRPASTAWQTDNFSGDADENSIDAKKINYFTPANWKKATGLTFAVGIAPNESIASNNATFTSSAGPQIAAAVAFDRKINDIGVYAHYNYSHSTDGGPNGEGKRGHGMGLELKSGPFTLGGAYTRALTSTDGTGSSQDGYSYSVGGEYKMGKWRFGLAYGKTIAQGGDTTAALAAADDKYSAWELASQYDLGKGINWRTSLYAVKQDEERGDLEASENSSGWAVVTGVVLGF